MVEMKMKHRYRHAEGKRWIEIRIKSPQQLFDSRDPAPFWERDLDDDFVEYIVASAREFSVSTPLKIMIYVEEKEQKDLPKEAIRSYLMYRIDVQRSELKSFVKRAQVFLVIGLLILISCLSVAQGMTISHPPGWGGILRDGIVIFGWVSIWKPIELILFDWYPIYETLRFYKKLYKTEIDIRFASE